MNTRFYFTDATADLTPTPDGYWSDTSDYVSKKLAVGSPDGSAFYSKTRDIYVPTHSGSPANRKILVVQAVSPQLNSKSAASGNTLYSLMFQGIESQNWVNPPGVYDPVTNYGFTSIWYKLSTTGTKTYLMTSSGILIENPAFSRTALTSRGGTVSMSGAFSLDAQDRIVIEVGLWFFQFSTSSSPNYTAHGEMRFGCPSGTDLVLNSQTDTSDNNPFARIGNSHSGDSGITIYGTTPSTPTVQRVWYTKPQMPIAQSVFEISNITAQAPSQSTKANTLRPNSRRANQ
jgi:hypothetical protein